MKNRIVKFIKDKNELVPLMLFVGFTMMMTVIYKFMPQLLSNVDDNPYTAYYNMSEIHDIIRRMMKIGSFYSVVVLFMWVLFPGAWGRLEDVMRNKEHEPKWIRDLFIFLFFLVSLLALVWV